MVAVLPRRVVSRRPRGVQSITGGRGAGVAAAAAGGYAAGYYSYIWAGVLARDAFAAFTDLEGDVVAEARLGRRWRREVLEHRLLAAGLSIWGYLRLPGLPGHDGKSWNTG